MSIELGQLPDGGLVIMSDMKLRSNICSVEYHKNRHVLVLYYDDPSYEALTSYELPDIAEEAVSAQNRIMIVDSSPHRKMHGYDVPLIHMNDR